MLFWCARVCAAVGYQMLAVAVGWQLYDLTGNPLDLGLVGLVQFIPAVALVLVVGQVADRYDRRMVLAACQAIQAVAAASLLAAVLIGAISRELILGVAFVMGIARAFELTVMQILVPGLVPLPLVPRAVAGSATANQTATIAGPALGGFLYAAGPAVVYSASLALFLVAGVLVALIRMERAPPAREPFSLKVFFAGFSFIRRNPIVLGAISLDLFAVLLGGVTALLPVFARDVFAAGPWALGLLRAAPAVGALTMAIVLTRWSFENHAGRIMFAGGRGLRHLDHRVRAVGLVRRRARRARGARRLRHGQRGDPHDAGAARDAGRDARPRHRGQRAVHRHVEPARRIPRRRHGGMARRGAGGADRRHRHAGDRGAVDAAVSAACADRAAGGRQGRSYSAAANWRGSPIASQ